MQERLTASADSGIVRVFHHLDQYRPVFRTAAEWRQIRRRQMGVLPPRISQAGQLFAEYRRYRFELFEMVLFAAHFYSDFNRQRHHPQQHPHSDFGHDRSGVVVDYFILDLLHFAALADYVENKNITFLMERDCGDFNHSIVIYNKLDII